jgi:hypothetical protein
MNEAQQAAASVIAAIPKDSGVGGWWALASAAVTAMVPISYMAFRKVRKDGSEEEEGAVDRRRVARDDDHTSILLKQQQDANAALLAQQEKDRARIDVLEKRADTFAGERNLSIASEARLLGEVNALKERVAEGRIAREEAKELVKSLGLKLDKLQADNTALTAANILLKERVATLEKQIEKLTPTSQNATDVEVDTNWTDR